MSHLTEALRVFSVECSALEEVKGKLDGNFNDAVDMILSSVGRVVVCGIGKSGIVGRKIAATLASTGTTAFFLHPAEAIHGDLGMIRHDDIILAFSHSGETAELVRLLPHFERFGNKVVAITGGSDSSLARSAAVVLDVAISVEACPLNLAPTASTTAAMVMGDALAAALMRKRGFSDIDFASFHPGGSLGKRLQGRVHEYMRPGPLPLIGRHAKFDEVVVVMTSQSNGIAIVDDELGRGVVTDGDLRRAFSTYGSEILQCTAETIMSRDPVTVFRGTRVDDAYKKMASHKVHFLCVVDEQRNLCGIFS
ncbi:KpsF/GutQ family sugar-phosphate isomerase [Rhodobacterales bacterium FZCC0188]|nr:KpsF/GutQ family sugar-phosphate isomerase [Rhodobacterales bacterium FZCC0188]